MRVKKATESLLVRCASWKQGGLKWLLVAALAATPLAAQPALLFDTGAGSGLSYPLYGTGPSNDFQFFAGQFTVTQQSILYSAQGWMSVAGPMTVAVKIYTNGVNNLPGTSLHSQNYGLGASSLGWVVFSNFNTVLAPGTYWLAFEPQPGSNFQALMPTAAPNPLPRYAFASEGPYSNSAVGGFGMRLAGAPVITIPTASPLPAASVGVAYSTSITASGGAPPYAFSFSGVPPAGLSLSASGLLSGTPTSTGTLSFSVRVTDVGNFYVATKLFTLPVSSTPFQLSASQISFTAPQGGVAPPVQSVAIQTQVQQPVQFTIVTDGGNPNIPAPAWLNFLYTPNLISVPVNQGTLAIGTYSGRILVSVTGDTPPPQVVNVTLTVVSAPTITTATPLPPATAGNPYSTTISATDGTAPYVFSFAGAPPAGLSLSASGVLSGTPNAAGTLSFTIQVTDAANNVATKNFTLTVSSQTSIFQLSASQLNFTAAQGGAAPPIQSLTIQTQLQQAVDFTIGTNGGNIGLPPPAWLTVSFQNTGAPSRITVSANQGILGAGTYTAQILIGVAGNTGQPPQVVNVTLTVVAAAPQLSVSSGKLEFTSKISTPGVLSQTVQLSNTGGGGTIAFAASVVNQSTWIKTITPTQGQAGTNSPTSVRVDIDTTGLPLGFQRDVIRFAWLGNNLDLPVIVFVAPRGAQLQLSRTGVYFRSNVGSLNLQTQPVRILNVDRFSAISWTATVLQGAEWISLSPSSGVSMLTDPASITLGVKPNASNLPAGAHYALIRIDALNTISAPQYVVGVLDIQIGTTTSGLDFDDAGAVLTAVTGSTQPVSHTFRITTGSSAPSVAFSASIASANGAGIFSINPASGALYFAASAQLTVTANPTNVAAGIYTAEIPVATAQGVRTLAVTLIVSGTVGGASLSAGVRPAACARSALAATQIGLTNSFSVPAGWPAALVVDLRDNCGAYILNGNVVASFSNGDPPLTLAGDGFSNLYSATWQPVAQVNPMAITIRASTSDLPEVTIPLTGGVTPNAVPILFRNGTVHNLDPKLGGVLSPGLVAAVYGANLASVIESTTAVPLPPVYKGTQVLIGPYTAPLFFVSPGQLNVQVPSELTPNQPYSVVVSVNGALTVPDTIALAPAVPGVAYYGDGRVIAQHNDFAAHPPYPFVVTAADPAKRDEYLIVYLVGLGITNPVVATGAPSPGTEPLGRPVVPVTVTLGGQAVEVPFVGLTPFAVGLFQINLKVPSDAPLNTPLDLVIKQGGITANLTTLTIAP